MSVFLTPLFVMLLGLVLYVLGYLVPKVAWLQPIAIVCFGVGLFHWLPGAHAAILR